MADDNSRLGELLVKERLITPLQLKRAMDSQRQTGGRLGHELTKLGYIEEYDIARAYRDVRLITIGGGTSEVMREIIAKWEGL